MACSGHPSGTNRVSTGGRHIVSTVTRADTPPAVDARCGHVDPEPLERRSQWRGSARVQGRHGIRNSPARADEMSRSHTSDQSARRERRSRRARVPSQEKGATPAATAATRATAPSPVSNQGSDALTAERIPPRTRPRGGLAPGGNRVLG